jgi:ribosomal protein L14
MIARLCIPIHDKLTKLLVIVACLWAVLLPSRAVAECRDGDAIAAANKKAASYFKKGEVFHPAVVQKIHHPSRKKEVASYIKVDKKRYSIIILVDQKCGVQFRKRTRQQD